MLHVYCVCAVHLLRCAYVNKYCRFTFISALVRWCITSGQASCERRHAMYLLL